MKSKILLLVAMVFASVSLFAQPSGGRQGGPGGQRQMPEPKEMAKTSVEALTKELKLDKKQEKAIYEIEFAKYTSMSEMMKGQQGQGQGQGENPREKMQEIEKKSDEAIAKVLKDDQKEKYTAYKKKQEEERAKRQQSGGGRQRQNN